MKKKIITCAGVSFVIIFVLLSVNFLQSGTGSISKENIEKENEFKKSLDVVAQEEEPDEVSKEFANKLGVDEKNIVSTGNAIKSTYYSFTVLSWTKGKEYPGYALPESKNLADYPGAVLDEQGNITNDFSYVVVNLSVKNQSDKKIENDLIWGYIRLRFLFPPSEYEDYVGEVSYLGEETPRVLNHNYYAETFEPGEEKQMALIFVANDELLKSEAIYLEINPTGAVIDNPEYDSGIDTSKVNYDTKIIEVSVCLKNTTEEEKEVPITYLSLETTGVGTAISQELLMGNSEHYGSMVEKLEPGEEKVVTYPYEMCSIWFHKKDWENVEKRSFWLTFSSYPDKIVLYL